MTKKVLNILVALAVLLPLIAGCAAPTPEVIEKEIVVKEVVKETVIVEKEKIVEKEVIRTVEVEKEVEVIVKETVEVEVEVEVEKLITVTPEEAKVGLVTDVGKVNDGTFNEYAYKGMMRAVEEFGLENAFIETLQPTDYEKNVEQFINEGYNMIVTVGFMMGETTQKMAEKYPDVKFSIVDFAYSPEQVPNNNIVGLTFREDQAGFLVGALAGLMSESKVIGIVAGMEIPPVKKFRNGYVHGIKYVCGDCEPIGVYIDSFTDPARGKAAAESQIAEGADVIFGAGGPTGSGGIKAAAQQGVWALGVDQDEYFTTFKGGAEAGADKLLSSAMKRVDVAVYSAVRDAATGTYKSGTAVFDAANSGVGLAPFHDAEDAVPDSTKVALKAIQAMLADGSLLTGVDPMSGDVVEAEVPAPGSFAGLVAAEAADEWGVVTVKKGHPIKIGFAAGLSGAGIDVLGIDEQRGAEIANEERPTIKGFAVELQVEDAMCNAEGGQTVANKFVADPQIVAVVGHMCSSSCTPASATYEQNHYTMVSPSCTAPSLTAADTGTEIFNRVSWNDKIQGPEAARFVKDVLGVNKVATIHDGSPYAEQLGQEFSKAFEAIGGEIVAAEAVNVGDTDMRPVLTSIKVGEPELIYFSAFVAEGAYLAVQRADVGMEDVIFMGADGIKADAFISAGGDAAEGVYASAADFAEAGPGLAAFLEKYKDKYGEDPIAPFHAHAYDAYMVIANAIEQVAQVGADGNLQIGRKALRDAIRGTKDYQGLTGWISCDQYGDCGTGTVAVSTVKDGEWVAAEAAAPAVPGGTFIFGRGGDSVQLDPAVVTDGESFRVTGQILEPLFQYEDGGTTPIPALATGYTVSDDGLEWIIYLRGGVKFHDGTDFNADAVVLNFERQWKTDHPLHFESQVYEYWEYMFNGFDEDCLITGIEAVDDLTVKITLREPLAPVLANLAMDIFAISSPAALEKYGADYGMPTVGAVGTGPFKFVEWVEDDHITVEANEDYWGGRPTIDRIIWRVIPDDSARFLALRAGDIHALEQANIEDIRAAEEDPDMYVEATGLNTGYLAFNYHIKELQDPKVREAIFHAIDREALREAFYGNYGQVASTFLHPSMWGRPEIEDWAYDPDLAKELLAEAGFPDGLAEVTNEDTGEVGPLKFYYMPVTRFYYPSPKEIGEAMAADLAKVGIDTELLLEGDWPTFLGARREGKLYGLYMLGWGGDNGDPDNFLNYFFGGLSAPGQVKEADPREGYYANQEVADLLYQAAVEPDPTKRAPLYEKVEQLLHEDRARLWVMHNDTPRILSSKISGFVVQPVGADKYERVIIAP